MNLMKIKNIIKNKKGMNSIEMAIGLLLIVVCVGFVTDLIYIVQSHSSMTQYVSDVTRQIGVQGGLKTSAPYGFPGGNQAYISSSEYLNKINDLSEELELPDNSIETRIIVKDGSGNIKQNKIVNTNSEIKADYKDTINVEIKYKTKWNFVSTIMFSSFETDTIVKQFSVSEFKYNYDDWGGK